MVRADHGAKSLCTPCWHETLTLCHFDVGPLPTARAQQSTYRTIGPTTHILRGIVSYNYVVDKNA